MRHHATSKRQAARRPTFGHGGAERLEPRRLLASIAGTVFIDANNNGKFDAGEGSASYQSQFVFLDTVGNGVVTPTTLGTSVDQFGGYSFGGLAAGTYRVTLEQDRGFARTTPAADYISVTVSASQNVTGANFGIVQMDQQFTGVVGNDANGNGKTDPSEPPLPGAAAYLDINGNGARDAAVQSSTNSTAVTATTAIGTSTISVGATTGLVVSAAVTVNLSTDTDKALNLFLEDPQGIRVQLLSYADVTSTGTNFTNTVFDDATSDAAQTLGQGTGSLTGTFRTSGETDQGFGLEQFNDLSPTGSWRLTVQNAGAAHKIVLNNWTLKLTVGDPQAVTDSFGTYYLPAYPGTYTVRAADAGFITTAPSGGKVTYTLKSTEIHEVDFQMEQTSGTSETVKMAAPATLNNGGGADSPFGIVTADFNGDGKPDLATAENGAAAVGLYLGKGNGQFNTPTFLPVGEDPRKLALGDFNGDGKPDIVVANNDGHTISVLLSNGNGTFKSQITTAAGTSPWSVAVGDFNGDGKADVAVGDGSTSQIRILLGKGNGTFNAGATLASGSYYVEGLAAADLNKDGKVDLVAANEGADGTAGSAGVSVLLGKGTGAFNSPVNFTVGQYPTDVAVADLNGDGKLDVAVTSGNASSSTNDLVNVMLGNGAGGLGADTVYLTGPFAAGVSVGDINQDGHPDLIVASRSDGTTSPSGDVRVYPGVGNGTFLPAFTFTTDRSPAATALVDLTGDGYPDIAVANFFSDDVSILVNQTKPAPGSIAGTVFKDTNSNGKLDSGEAGLSGVKVYLDQNNNGVADSGEPSVTVGTAGTYAFTGLSYGTFHVREVIPSGYTVTTPASDLFTATLANGQAVTGVNFGNAGAATPSGSIAGTVFKDANANGKLDAGEADFSGIKVYLDLTNNGVLDSTDPTYTTSSNGAYSFNYLPAGTFYVREVIPSGYTVTTPANGVFTSTLVSGQAVTGANFGNAVSTTPTPTPTGVISGTVFKDANGNGKLDSGEAGFSGVKVYLDLNNNGALDSTDPTYTTGSNGAYAFNYLPAGTFYVREVIPAGYTVTTPASDVFSTTLVAAQKVTTANFGNAVATPTPTGAISGTVFKDANRNGILDSGEADFSGVKLYLDLNNNGVLDSTDPTYTVGANGAYAFNYLPAGTFHVREVIPTGYTLTTPVGGAFNLTLVDGQKVTGANFGNA